MDENTEKTEYLTVKDVAALVRRNEETIRRMIRARKLDVELSNNNRRQGYMISVDQLVNTWDISREDVERYISARRAEEKPDAPERIPIGQREYTRARDKQQSGACGRRECRGGQQDEPGLQQVDRYGRHRA